MRIWAKSHELPQESRAASMTAVSDILAISGLHAGYGAGDILKGIDAVVQRGKVVTVIGPVPRRRFCR